MGAKKYHSRNALIYIDDVDYSGESNSVSITTNVSDADTSCFLEDADTGEQGPYNWAMQHSGFASGNGSTGITDKLFALKTAGTKKVLVYPQSSGAGNHYLYGLGYQTGIPVTCERKSAVAFQNSMKGDGGLFNYAAA